MGLTDHRFSLLTHAIVCFLSCENEHTTSAAAAALDDAFASMNASPRMTRAVARWYRWSRPLADG